MDHRFNIFQTVQQLNDALCRNFADALHRMTTSGKPIYLALSGGNTPQMFLRRLSVWNDENNMNPIDWSNIHFFWVDERCVPPGHPESNFGTAHSGLLSGLELKPEQIHRIRGENDPVNEVHRYAEEIRRTVPLVNAMPAFDQIFLGVGEDGHTASIFPGFPGLMHSGNICELAVHPVTGQQRISLTLKTINNARRITFIVTGETKSNIIGEITGHSASAEQYPVHYVMPVHGTLEWYLDQKAAKHIT